MPDPSAAGGDRATVAVTLATRLRGAGVGTSMADVESLLRAVEALPMPDFRAAARLTLVHRREDLATFDRIFETLVGAALAPSGPGVAARRTIPTPTTAEGEGSGPLPWVTPRAVATSTLAGAAGEAHAAPIRRPQPEMALLDAPFETLTPDQVDAMGRWLAERVHDWPTRRSRRRRTAATGSTPDLRATLRRARRTGWEPVVLARSAPRRRPRRLLMVCDVSRSMQADVAPLLHLMRAVALAGPAEVFTAGTTLTRVTASLRRPDPAEALAATTAATTDRLGGTRLADSLSTLLQPRHEPLLRGAVMLIASDGWDTAAPDEVAHVVGRIHRRTHRLLWANPRASSVDFEPRVATLAAALGECDDALPAGSFTELATLLDRLLAPRGSRAASLCNAKM